MSEPLICFLTKKINPMEQDKPFETICEKCGQVHNRCAGHPKRKNTDGVLRPCNKFPVKGKDVCERCGGKTPGGMANPHFKDGKHSKYQYLPPNFSSRLETVISDHIENIEHSIEIQKTLETTYLEKLGTNESTEAWSKLRQAVKDYDIAAHNPDSAKANQGKAQAFGMIRFIVNEGLSQAFLYRDIQSIQESQRKLSETLSKVRKEAQEIFTHEQWNEMLSTLVVVLKNNIPDQKILQAIQEEIYARSNNNEQNPKQLTTAR